MYLNMSRGEFELLITPNFLLVETIFLEDVFNPLSQMEEDSDILVYGLPRPEGDRGHTGFYSYYVNCKNDLLSDYSERVYRASDLGEVMEVVKEIKKVHQRVSKRLKVA